MLIRMPNTASIMENSPRESELRTEMRDAVKEMRYGYAFVAIGLILFAMGVAVSFATKINLNDFVAVVVVGCCVNAFGWILVTRGRLAMRKLLIQLRNVGHPLQHVVTSSTSTMPNAMLNRQQFVSNTNDLRANEPPPA